MPHSNRERVDDLDDLGIDVDEKLIAFTVYVANPATEEDHKAIQAAEIEADKNWPGFGVRVLPISTLMLPDSKAPILLGFSTSLGGYENIRRYFANGLVNDPETGPTPDRHR